MFINFLIFKFKHKKSNSYWMYNKTTERKKWLHFMYDNTTAKSCICAATRSLIKYQSNKSYNVLHLNDSVNQETTNSCTLHISIMMIMRPSLDLLIIISKLSQRKFDARTHNQVYSFARHNFHSTFLLC